MSKTKEDIYNSLSSFSNQEKEHILSFLKDIQDGKKINRDSIRKWLKDDFYIVPATSSGIALGRSILLRTGIISRSCSMAIYKLEIVCA